MGNRSRLFRPGSALLLIGALGFACPPPQRPLPPAPGAPAWQTDALVSVPGGVVNAAGGNLLVRRVHLEIDTRIGTRAVASAYNATDGRWRFDFDLHYDGRELVDAEGAAHDAAVPDGTVLPGTTWRRADADTLATRGGLVHDFAADGRLVAVYWASDPWPRLVYVAQPVAGARRVVRIEECTAPATCEPVFDLTRDAQGRVTRIDDRAGRSARLFWDGAGGLVQARDALDLERGTQGVRYEYADGRLAAVTNAEGERVEYRYQGPRLAEVEQAGAGHPVHRFTYLRPSGGLFATRYRDPSGVETTLRYDADRRVVEVENALGERTLTDWDGRRVVARTDAAGLTTRWTWSGDEVATRVSPGGREVRFTWQTGGVNREAPHEPALARSEDDLGVLEERDYDAAGRLVAVRNGAGETTHMDRDAMGRIVSVTSPAGLVTTFSGHGPHGHPTRVDGPLGSAAVPYDAVGNRLGGPGGAGDGDTGRGGVLSRRFDGDRNLAEIVLVEDVPLGAPLVHTLVIERRADGRPLRVVRPYGGETVFVYDGVGRLVARRELATGTPYPDWTETRFEWDPAGRPLAVERPNGMREEWSWDAAGRLAHHRILRSGMEEAAASYTWAEGRLVRVDDSARGGAEEIFYDAWGRVFGIAHPDGGYEVMAYDARSREVARTRADPAFGFQHTVGYGYDAAGRLVRLSDGGEVVVDRTFTAGRLARVVTGNGLERRFTYDAGNGLVRDVSTLDAQGSTVASTGLELVESGLGCAGVFCVRATTSTFAGVVATTSEEYQLSSARPPGAEGFEGLRLFRDSVDTGPDFKDRLRWYDARGGLRERSIRDGSLHCGNEVFDRQGFVYNPERNRLQRIHRTDCPGDLHAYAYDAAGFVTARDGIPIRWDGAGRIAAVGDVAQFVWDTRGRPVERTLDGVTQRMRFGGAVQADAAGRPVAIDLGDVRIDLADGSRLYRHADFRHNPRFVTDDAGRVRSHVLYHGYGVERVLGEDLDREERFARGLDLGGLVRLGHRLYDPAAARFLAPDPVFQWVDGYVYAAGNPVRLWDPSGLAPSAVGLGFGASVAIGAELGGVAGSFLGIAGSAVGAVTGGLVAGGLYAMGVDAFSPGTHWTLGSAFEALMPPAVEPVAPPGGFDRPGSPPSSAFARPGSAWEARAISGSNGIGPARWHGPPSRPEASSRGLAGGALAAGEIGGPGGGGAGGCYAPMGRQALPDWSDAAWLLLPLALLFGGRARRAARVAKAERA